MKINIIIFIIGLTLGGLVVFKLKNDKPAEIVKEQQVVHDVKTITRTIKEPNGKVITEYITDTKTETKVIKESIKKSYRLGPSIGYDIKTNKPNYGIVIGKYLTQNMVVALQVNNQKQVGLLVDISF